MKKIWIKIRPVFCKYREEVIWDYGCEPAHWTPRWWVAIVWITIGIYVLTLLSSLP